MCAAANARGEIPPDPFEFSAKTNRGFNLKMAGDRTISTGNLARMLRLTVQRVQQLTKDGVISKTSHGKYPDVSALHEYFDHRQATALAKVSQGPSSDDKLKQARILEVELRTAERQELHLVQAREESIAVVNHILGGLRADLSAAPARITGDRQMRLKIETVLDDALRSAAGRADDLASGRTPIGDDSAASAEDVA